MRVVIDICISVFDWKDIIMTVKNECRACEHCRIKRKIVGGLKYRCTVSDGMVAPTSSCNQFSRDPDRTLELARFRGHEFGSTEGCDTCSYRESSHENGVTTYFCKYNDVQFWAGFSPMDYICDYHKNGGIDALVGSLADLIIETHSHKGNT